MVNSKEKTYIIAEIAQGYEGNPFLVRKFIDTAKKCGADAVKFQIFKAEEISTVSYKDYAIFKSLEFSNEIWCDLIEYSSEVGIDFWADIFGVETYNWISKTRIKGFKIHSTDIKNKVLLAALMNSRSRILLSTGGSELSEIANAIKVLGENELALLTGFQAEPNQLEDIELDKIEFLRNKFGKEEGYADHFDASNSFSLQVPALAVLKGASIIEKHLTLDREYLKLEDYVSALNPDEFAKMVNFVRNVEKIRKSGDVYTLSEREAYYRSWTKKCVVAARFLKRGEVIDYSNVVLLRTRESNPDFFEYDEVLGREVLNDIVEHQILKKSDLI